MRTQPTMINIFRGLSSGRTNAVPVSLTSTTPTGFATIPPPNPPPSSSLSPLLSESSVASDFLFDPCPPPNPYVTLDTGIIVRPLVSTGSPYTVSTDTRSWSPSMIAFSWEIIPIVYPQMKGHYWLVRIYSIHLFRATVLRTPQSPHRSQATVPCKRHSTRSPDRMEPRLRR